MKKSNLRHFLDLKIISNGKKNNQNQIHIGSEKNLQKSGRFIYTKILYLYFDVRHYNTERRYNVLNKNTYNL